jgi:hypothetical protein
MSQQYFFGCKRDPNQYNDSYLLLPVNSDQLALVTSIDLRPVCPPIYDQGNLNSCVANAVAFCIQFDQIKYQLAHQFIPSRLFIYYNIRVIEGTVPEDSGAYIHDAIVTINQKGGCPETLWPYNISKFEVKPTNTAYISGYAHLAPYSAQLSLDLNQMKQCLVNGYPFIFGILLYASFATVGANGIVPIPSPNETILGGHAMVCVGFNDTQQRFIVCNSWGTDWGDHGVCYIPYAYLSNPYYVWDLWTIREVNDLEFDVTMINNAIYGKNDRFIDVTAITKNQFAITTQLLVSNKLFTDPYPGVVKELRVSLRNDISLVIPENNIVYQSDLNYINIKSVSYGKNNRFKNVTNIFKNNFSVGNHSINVTNRIFSDPYPGVVKELRITFTDNSVLIYPENSVVYLSQISSHFNVAKIMYITGALYGKNTVFIDVLNIVKNHFNKGYPLLHVSNTLFTDPYNGVVKELRLSLSNGTTLIYPESSYVILGSLVI